MKVCVVYTTWWWCFYPIKSHIACQMKQHMIVWRHMQQQSSCGSCFCCCCTMTVCGAGLHTHIMAFLIRNITLRQWKLLLTLVDNMVVVVGVVVVHNIDLLEEVNKVLDQMEVVDKNKVVLTWLLLTANWKKDILPMFCLLPIYTSEPVKSNLSGRRYRRRKPMCFWAQSCCLGPLLFFQSAPMTVYTW